MTGVTRRALVALVASTTMIAGLLTFTATAYAATAPTAIPLTSSSCPTDITEGEVDGCVTELQDLLNVHGAGISVDGDFGPGTLAAVKSFQSGHGLTADGVVGPQTKAALDASVAPSPISLTSASCPTDISEGELDGCVTELQDLLNSHGASIAVDGDFGPGTLAAVESFQSSHGLSVDGIVGPNTKAALDSAGGTVPAAVSITSSSCPTDMQEGEIDGCVTDLQELLNQNGANLSVDGDFGPATLAAVENYQSSHGLSVDGVVGPDTKAALTGNAPPTNNPPPPSASTLQSIVSYATAIENGDAEKGWSGGKVPYGWAGGHGSSPGPSPANCAAAGGDPDCWTATQNGTAGHNGQISVDCSGFTRWVYSLAYGSDVLGPDGTQAQISEMTRVTSPSPGDLVFFGSSVSATEHVGIYIGNGKMINSYETGYYIQTNNVSDVSGFLGYYQYGSGSSDTGGTSTNYDWAKLVLSDGGWPQSSNNVTTITQWMSSEEPPSSWWNNINPLNNGYGSGGGSGLGSYPNLTTAADYVAQNLQKGSDYAQVVSDFSSSAAPATTATAIIDSDWSCGHYSGSASCNSDTAEWGAAYNHG
ncbi:MAG: peptidoglycan-binding protein [Actinobacteria bacterium]|nr:peptidoglycan-binding protein [Actinomycetota bacterium]